MKKFIIILLIVLWAGVGFAADRNIYIDADAAAGGTGAIDSPYDAFADIPWSGVEGALNDVADWVANGDDVYINLQGTFTGEYVNAGTAGTADHRITIQSYGGDKAIVDGNDTRSQAIRIAVNYITIKDLKVTGGTGAGIGTSGTPTGIKIDGVESYENNHGIYALGVEEIKNCIVYDNDKSGIFAGSIVDGCVIHNNHIYDNGTTLANDDGIFIGNSSGKTGYVYSNKVERQAGGSGIDSSNETGNDPSTFYIYGNYVGMTSDGTRGITGGDDVVSDTFYMFNNFVTGSPNYLMPIGSFSKIGTYHVYNNTLVGDGGNYGVMSASEFAKTINFKNNIIYNVEHYVYVDTTLATLDFSNNVYYGAVATTAAFELDGVDKTFTTWKAAGYDTTGSSEADPLLTTSGRLIRTSPAIDAGIWIDGVNDQGYADPWGKYVHRLPNIGADQGAGTPISRGMLRIGR